VAGSGLVLSGLYARRPDVMAFAVLKGGALDGPAAAGAPGPGALAEELRAIARLYDESGSLPPFARLVTDLRLATVFARDGVSSNATFEALRPYLPPERAASAPGARDWEYLTDFLHHKLLLVDAQRVQLGGRNIEDSYHMRPNPLLDKYVFVDTDLYATLARGGEHLQGAFEALWNFRTMVASTAEIRQHAPNDFVANLPAYGAASLACAATAPGPARDACVLGEFGRRAVALAGREQQHETAMRQRARAYYARYPHAAATDDAPEFDLDPGALVAYIENLPFRGRRPSPPYERSYGAENGAEARYGKHIHALWRAGLLHACRTAGERPGPAVILHNAYFFPPSNLVETFGRMADGSADCGGASVVVLTNSAETTDLNVINLLARHSLKAFVDYLAARRDPARSAQFAIYEYRKFGGGDRISLHTKVSVLGDDLIVGSANADVRSYMMDSNNGFFIRGVSRLRQDYLRYLDGLMRDETKTRDMTAYYQTTPRATMVEEDRRTFRQLLAQYGADQLAAPLQAELEQRFVGLLDLVYELTRATLEGGRQGRQKAAEFNRLFKPL
jgi:phosphatidylserine/phosphatidylglycerophosphate/cardiolipin synthase-like enzyme